MLSSIDFCLRNASWHIEKAFPVKFGRSASAAVLVFTNLWNSETTGAKTSMSCTSCYGTDLTSCLSPVLSGWLPSLRGVHGSPSIHRLLSSLLLASQSSASLHLLFSSDARHHVNHVQQEIHGRTVQTTGTVLQEGHENGVWSTGTCLHHEAECCQHGQGVAY